MQIMNIKNDLGLNVLIDENFNLSKINQTESALIVSLLEEEIYKLVVEAKKRNKYYENSKKKKPP